MRTNAYPLIPPAVCISLFCVFAGLYQMRPDLYASALQFIGVRPFRFPFLDLSSIGADAECWKQGINVYLENPCDVLNRLHNYSPLWLRITFVPTGYDATIAMGIILDCAFFVSLYWIIRPVRWSETVFAALCCCSTTVVYAAERGNVDVFLLLFFVASIFLASGSLWSRAIAYSLILVAGLLKFYPLAALSLIARERARWFVAFGAVSSIVLAAFVAQFKDELLLMKANVPFGSILNNVFGAMNLPTGIVGLVSLALDTDTPRLAALKVIVYAALLMAACLAALSWTRLPGLQSAYNTLSSRTTFMMTMGATLIAGCFFAGQNVSYRGIFLIFVVASLIELRRGATLAPCRHALSILAATIVFMMWERMFQVALISDRASDVRLLASIMLVREVLWWNLISFLLAMIALFAASAPGLAWALPTAWSRSSG